MDLPDRHPRHMDAVRRKLGFYDTDPAADADIFRHTGMISIGNDKIDRWCMMPALVRREPDCPLDQGNGLGRTGKESPPPRSPRSQSRPRRRPGRSPPPRPGTAEGCRAAGARRSSRWRWRRSVKMSAFLLSIADIMTQDELKQAVARAAIDYVVDGEIIGVGTGSTANFFIDELAKIKDRIKGTVASSEATAARLRGHGIPCST
jgi:hypothetical protein